MPLGQVPRNRRPNLRHEVPVQRLTLLHEQEQHHALVQVLVAPLPDADALLDPLPEVPLEDGVNVRAAEAYAARVEHAVRPAEHEHAARLRVHHAKVPLRPRPVEAREVRRPVLGTRSRVVAVVPQEDGHVGERVGSYQVARGPWRKGAAFAALGELVVVDGDGNTEAWTLAATDVDWCQGVLADEAASLDRVMSVSFFLRSYSEGGRSSVWGERRDNQGRSKKGGKEDSSHNVGASRDVAEMHAGRESHIVEPLEQLLRQDHAGADDILEPRQVKLVAWDDAVIHQLA